MSNVTWQQVVLSFAYWLGYDMGASVAGLAWDRDFEDMTRKRDAFYEAHDRLLLRDPRSARALSIGYKRGVRNYS